MRISEALGLFTHLIALLGFAAIGFTGHIGALGIAFFLFSLGISFANERLGKPYYLSQNIVTVLAFALLAYVLGGVFFLGVEVFGAILTFLVYTQAIKLLGRKELRDVTQIFILSFFQFLAGSILTVDFSYALAFVLYVVVALWAVMTLTIKKESSEAANEDDPAVVTPLFLSASIVASALIFLFTAFLFISFPRIKAGVFMSDFIRPEFLKTGFSDEIKLGRVGEIKRDSSAVMRVRILDNPYPVLPQSIYWRGIALDEFDGVSWRAGDFDAATHKEGRDGVIAVGKARGGVLAQEIITEPLDTDILFAADAPVGFRALASKKISSVNDSYILPGRASFRLKYTAYSDLSAPSPQELSRAGEDYPQFIKERYLSLPPIPERVGALALEITSLERTPYDKAIAIKRYLLANMSYTLTLDGGDGAFPLEDFLFDSRAGHCEYFATAMVVLLREAGVPARIVNGFLGGEWNEHGEFFLVRESEAHSWVEAYFPQSGWALFDPTPASDAATGAIAGSLKYIISYFDYLRYRWNRYVVDFNQRDQIRIFNNVRDGWRWQGAKLKNRFNLGLKSNVKTIAAAALAALGLWVLFAMRGRANKFLFRRRARIEGDERASLIYRKALSVLSKKGMKKPDFLTQREFARAVSDAAGEFSPFSELTERYLDLRFRQDPATQGEIDELKYLLSSISSGTKKTSIR
ncbi:MAG: transglutaminase TgpA family protein [Deltaproteobacteria bacterium]